MGGGPPGFNAGSSCPHLLWILPCLLPFRLQDSHLLWYAFPCISTKESESIMQSATPVILLYPVWPLSLSLAATKEIDVSFSSSSYLDVSVQRVPFHTLWIHAWITGSSPAWFPNSEIRGSMDICSNPQLIEACHVLLRLLMPSHPPYALISLTS